MNQYPAKCGAIPLWTSISAEALTAFERASDITLPVDYRTFLLEWNGVHFELGAEYQYRGAVYPVQPKDRQSDHAPSWDLWIPQNRKDVWECVDDVDYLYGIADEWPRLSKAVPGYDFELWAPSRFLAIGTPSMMHGHVCISLEGRDCGHIYNWVWPEEMPIPGENSPTMDYISWIAPNFREFWDVLRPMSENEWRAWNP